MKDLNNFKAAELNYKKGISCDPKNYVIYTNLGITYNILGEFNKAKECFKNSIKINPHFMLAHRNLSALIKFDIVIFLSKGLIFQKLYKKIKSMKPEIILDPFYYYNN